MRLLRVQVPDFRVLQNVDITFEKDFFPNIFPLGSQNGGGKSTLLQLIFGLLHCSYNPDRVDFLKNLLNGFQVERNERELAIIDIGYMEENVRLNFFAVRKVDTEEIESENEGFPFSAGGGKVRYIFKYSASRNEIEDYVLVSRIDNIDINQIESFLKDLAQKIFLAAPATQVFLFLATNSKKLLFREPTKKNDYYSHLKDAKSKLPGFFTYDFLAVELLTKSLRAAIAEDMREVTETGKYGNSYKELIKDLHLILGNKKINLEPDFYGVNFKLDKDGETVELYPEDLSHGELKRLSIYMWLKYYNIENAIVLMDEIEIAFHPDWQYQIISDLKEWAPSNQYILATHSYELCQALTPAHVKELEPKLLKQNPSN
ncbi:AAA family ATPase [Argonema antarcticum]|uniref:AAA family ATPase n=1 Tax=Argonema antarcticum TaxID=2942763 RepID=UPI00201233AA|nr:AAA family ATPase [Argonema antarcticum]MCL1472741.1 ATP-binding protein [Argonema antarcticum A004/B2]